MCQAPLVQLTAVSKSYDNGTAALVGFDMALAEGEFVSLLGPSGCGKSTALRMIAGLDKPTTGGIRRSWEAAPSVKAASTQAVSCVFQEPTLLPWTDVWNNVYLPLRLSGASKSQARSRVEEALSLVGLGPFARGYPRELSGGMKMRTSVARALVTQPRLLLLDEPFAALDEITRARLNDDLLQIRRRRGWTGLFITHSVYEAVYLSTRVLVMSPRPGRVVDEINIDLPAERNADTRICADYLTLCARVSRSLQRATGEIPAGAAHG